MTGSMCTSLHKLYATKEQYVHTLPHTEQHTNPPCNHALTAHTLGGRHARHAVRNKSANDQESATPSRASHSVRQEQQSMAAPVLAAIVAAVVPCRRRVRHLRRHASNHSP
jgi:hypothetical protein